MNLSLILPGIVEQEVGEFAKADYPEKRTMTTISTEGSHKLLPPVALPSETAQKTPSAPSANVQAVQHVFFFCTVYKHPASAKDLLSSLSNLQLC